MFSCILTSWYVRSWKIKKKLKNTFLAKFFFFFPCICVYELVNHKTVKSMKTSLYWKSKKQHSPKNVFFLVFFSYLRTKTLKCLQNTLHGKKQITLTETSISFYFLSLSRTKVRKCMQSALYMDTKHYEKRAVWVFSTY